VEVPSEITVTTSHFSQVVASQEDGFGNNRHINRHVTDRETSQAGGDLTLRTPRARSKADALFSAMDKQRPAGRKHCEGA
jgi:hypothetical protein